MNLLELLCRFKMFCIVWIGESILTVTIVETLIYRICKNAAYCKQCMQGENPFYKNPYFAQKLFPIYAW